MNVVLVKAVWLIWLPVSAILFRVIGPRRAVLVGLLGGLLFLPDGHLKQISPALPLPVDKYNVTGLGLILGVLLFDRRSLLRARPHWLDLPMAGFYLAPLIGLIAGVPGSSVDILDVLIGRGLGWVVPYVMGRLYFGRADGPPMVGVALMISGLLYVPCCLYEEVAGPSRYLAGLIYQVPYETGRVDRLGGWRPEVFLGNGLAVSSWMALTTVVAAGLWLGVAWRPRRWPAWLPALALLATTLSCRGVYGYIILATGLATLLLTRLLRSRVILVALAAVPFAYMAARGTGLWDGEILVKLAGFTGRPDTVDWRLQAENEVIHRVLSHNPFFGFGNYVWNAQLHKWPDGSWLHALWMGGLVGLALQLSALYVLPAALALSRPLERPDRWQSASPAWGLAIWCLLQMIDGLHNTNYFMPTALIAGTLIGAFLSKGAYRPETRLIDRKFERDRAVAHLPLVLVSIVLLAIEFLGHLPRTPALGPSPPPALDNPSRIGQPSPPPPSSP